MSLETLLDLHSFRMWCLDCKRGCQWFFCAEKIEVSCAVHTFILEHHGHAVRVTNQAPKPETTT